MTSNTQKIPFTRSLSAFARARALDEIRKRGLALPGHVKAVNGSIVTVNFDVKGRTLPQVTMPIFGPEYIRYPVQVGDLGVAFPADVYLGGVSGLGGGTADMSLPGNLSTLVWFPIGNKAWSAADPNALTLYGKTHTTIQDSVGAAASIDVTGSGITMAFGSHSIVIDSAGVHIDGKLFLSHEHSGVQTGGGNTGPVTP